MRNRIFLALTVVFVLACSSLNAPQVIVVTATPPVQPQVIVVTATPGATEIPEITSTMPPTATSTLTSTPTSTPKNTPTITPTLELCSTHGETTAESGQTIRGILNDVNCYDAWKITANKGDKITIQIRIVTGNPLVIQGYYDNNGTLELLTTVTATKDTVGTLEGTADSDGDYYFFVKKQVGGLVGVFEYDFQYINTAYSGPPTVSVSVDTQCRMGPGKNYPQVSGLLVGEVTEVVAVGGNNADYWIVKNPDGGGTCWLWGYYATVNGSTEDLPVIVDLPPVPDPIFPSITLASVYKQDIGCAFSVWGEGYEPEIKIHIMTWEYVDGDWVNINAMTDYPTDDEGNWAVYPMTNGMKSWNGGPLYVEVQTGNNGSKTLAKIIPSVSCSK